MKREPAVIGAVAFVMLGAEADLFYQSQKCPKFFPLHISASRSPQVGDVWEGFEDWSSNSRIDKAQEKQKIEWIERRSSLEMTMPKVGFIWKVYNG